MNMAWGSLLGLALLLTLAIVVLRALWCWLLVLLVLGPPAYVGIIVGCIAGKLARDIGVGLFAAVVVTALLTTFVRRTLLANTERTMSRASV